MTNFSFDITGWKLSLTVNFRHKKTGTNKQTRAIGYHFMHFLSNRNYGITLVYSFRNSPPIVLLFQKIVDISHDLVNYHKTGFNDIQHSFLSSEQKLFARTISLDVQDLKDEIRRSRCREKATRISRPFVVVKEDGLVEYFGLSL